MGIWRVYGNKPASWAQCYSIADKAMVLIALLTLVGMYPVLIIPAALIAFREVLFQACVNIKALMLADCQSRDWLNGKRQFK